MQRHFRVNQGSKSKILCLATIVLANTSVSRSPRFVAGPQSVCNCAHDEFAHKKNMRKVQSHCFPANKLPSVPLPASTHHRFVLLRPRQASKVGNCSGQLNGLHKELKKDTVSRKKSEVLMAVQHASVCLASLTICDQ